MLSFPYEGRLLRAHGPCLRIPWGSAEIKCSECCGVCRVGWNVLRSSVIHYKEKELYQVGKDWVCRSLRQQILLSWLFSFKDTSLPIFLRDIHWPGRDGTGDRVPYCSARGPEFDPRPGTTCCSVYRQSALLPGSLQNDPRTHTVSHRSP